MDDFPHPEPCSISKDQIYDIAEKLAKKLGYEPGTPLVPLVEDLGGEVVYAGSDILSKTKDGSIVVTAPRNFKIYIPQEATTSRNRFTIAHELGHYFLHYPIMDSDEMKAERYGSSRVEWEANWFSAGFLMPRKAFIAALKKHDGYMSYVAADFRVPLEAAEIQADFVASTD